MHRLSGLCQDIVLAVRLLRKAPAFTVAAVVTLALGVGVNVAVFSIVNAFILSPLPVSASDRLVLIAGRSTADSNLGGLSFADLQDFRVRIALASSCRAARDGLQPGVVQLEGVLRDRRLGRRAEGTRRGHRYLLSSSRRPDHPDADGR